MCSFISAPYEPLCAVNSLTYLMDPRCGLSFPFSSHSPHIGWALTTLAFQKYEPTVQEIEQYYESLTQWKENVDPKVLTEINRRRKAKGLKAIQTTKEKRPPNSYAL